ncbi:MAG: cytochrome c [Myxococcales bacterium]|nr:cytochrome c [Myxococcales bacterium]
MTGGGRAAVAGLGLAAATLAACPRERPGWAERPFEAEVVLADGTVLELPTLEAGRRSYLRHCYGCHGLDGDGQGPVAAGLRPPPRDLRRAVFKFGGVTRQALLTDDDLARIVRDGLAGTAMLGRDLPDAEVGALVAFVKTFPAPPCDRARRGAGTCRAEAEAHPEGAPNRWRARREEGSLSGQARFPVGEPIAAPEDPWRGREGDARERGKLLYHARAGCDACHPAYVTRAEYAALSIQSEGAPKSSYRDDMYRPAVRPAADNEFGVDVAPPDFTRDRLRSVRDDRELDDLYVRIAAGVGGGLMPSWLESAELAVRPGETPSELIYALAHYVSSLCELRGTEGADALWRDLAAQP